MGLQEGPRGEAPWGPCTFLPAWRRASASSAEIVLFPTPPFPERMRMTRGLPARPPSSGGERGLCVCVWGGETHRTVPDSLALLLYIPPELMAAGGPRWKGPGRAGASTRHTGHIIKSL